RQLQAEHDGSGDLGVHHQVAAVADEHDDVALGLRELDADRACYLVAHAGVAVFQVVAVGTVRAPQFVQFAGQSAGCAHDGCIRTRGAVDHAEHIRIAGQTVTGSCAGCRVDSLVPFRD